MKAMLVTGGGSGIGRATALAFATAGYGVTVADANKEAAHAVAAHINEGGGKALAIHTDVTDPLQCRDMVGVAVAHFGQLDAAFNNAGVTEISLLKGEPSPETHLLPLAIWQKVLAVDLEGVFNCLQAELPAMLAAGKGAIVNTASLQGHVAVPRSAAYIAAKHGVIGLTKAVAKEYGGQGIRCNAVSPGIVDTPLTTKVIHSAAYESALLGAIPQGRFADGEDVARAVLWLCSDGAGYVNGVTLPVDGGFLA